MVRFWSHPHDYAAFTKACEQQGLVIQDVFGEFMRWFVSASDAGKLQFQPPPNTEDA